MTTALYVVKQTTRPPTYLKPQTVSVSTAQHKTHKLKTHDSSLPPQQQQHPSVRSSVSHAFVTCHPFSSAQSSPAQSHLRQPHQTPFPGYSSSPQPAPSTSPLRHSKLTSLTPHRHSNPSRPWVSALPTPLHGRHLDRNRQDMRKAGRKKVEPK